MRAAIFKCHSLFSATVVLLLLAAAIQTAGATPIYRGLDDKPADPAYSPTLAPFTCQPADSLTLTVGATATLADSTIGREMVLNGYPCAPWAETGPELIYRLDLAGNLELSARLSDMDGAADLDLFLLNDCETDSCLVGANTEFRLELTAGIYFLIVDTTAPLDTTKTSGTFTLNLSTRPLGVPESICETGGALPVDCAGETITITGEDLFDQPNLIQTYSCGTSPKTSGDLWYRVSQPGVHEVTINVRDVAPDLDVNLWLFDSCGPDAQCLQFVDKNLGSEGETLTWINPDATPVTAWLAVDAVRPQTGAGLGSYTIDFQCQSDVPNEATSFGTLKALYR